MLNRLLMAVLLSFILPPAFARATTPNAPAPQRLVRASNATCNAEQTAILEIFLFRLGHTSNSQPTPDQLGMESALLRHQLRLIAQLPLSTSRINPLSAVVSRLTVLAALTDLDLTRRAELQSVITQTADLIARIGAERSVAKAELLTQLARTAHSLGQTDQAKALLQQTYQTVATIQGHDFKAQALMAVADSQAQTGDRTAAIATLAEAFLTAQRIIPSPAYPGKRDDTLSRLVTLHSQLDEFSQAMAIANTMQDANPQGYAQVSLVQALLGHKQLESALQVARSIRKPELKAWALSAIGNFYGAEGQNNQATKTFNTAFTTAQQQPTSNTSSFYPGLMAAQVVQNYGKWQPDTALRLAESLPNPPSRALALISIATTYRNTDRMAQANALLAKAKLLIQQFDVNQHRTVTNSLIEIALGAKSYDWALQMANLIPLTDEAGNLREAMVGQIIYTALNQGQLDAALQGIDQLPPQAKERSTWVHRAIGLTLKQGQVVWADQIVQARFVANVPLEWIKAQYAIAKYEHQAGQTNSAKARLNSATQRINGLTNPVQKGWELVTLVATYSQIGESALAAQRFAEVLRLAQTTNETPSAQPAFLVGSTRPLLDAGLYEWAYQLAQTIPTYELQTPESIEVMQAILQRQDFDLAKRLIPTTRSPENKTQLFSTLAEYYIGLNQPELATATLAQAVAAARTIPDPEVRQTLVMGAGAYDYNDFTDRASQLEVIAQRYAYLNQIEQANQTLNLIQTADLRRQLSRRLRCYRAVGRD